MIKSAGLGVFTYVPNSTLYEIWTLKNMGAPSISKFKPHAPQNITTEEEEGAAILSWDHHSLTDDFWNGYKIYRSITHSPPATSFIEIGQTSKFVTGYMDEFLTLGTYEVAFYKVVALNNGLLSDFSNTAIVGDQPHQVLQ